MNNYIKQGITLKITSIQICNQLSMSFIWLSISLMNKLSSINSYCQKMGASEVTNVLLCRIGYASPKNSGTLLAQDYSLPSLQAHCIDIAIMPSLRLIAFKILILAGRPWHRPLCANNRSLMCLNVSKYSRHLCEIFNVDRGRLQLALRFREGSLK